MVPKNCEDGHVDLCGYMYWSLQSKGTATGAVADRIKAQEERHAQYLAERTGKPVQKS